MPYAAVEEGYANVEQGYAPVQSNNALVHLPCAVVEMPYAQFEQGCVRVKCAYAVIATSKSGLIDYWGKLLLSVYGDWK